MSRYPSESVARFDQQFRESESERNARLRKKRLPVTAKRDDEDVANEYRALTTPCVDEDDLLQRMRDNARCAGYLHCQLLREGADEIERLRSELGKQP